MTRLILLLAATCCIWLAACGQSGPLYLPGDPSKIREAPQPAESADEEDDENGNRER